VLGDQGSSGAPDEPATNVPTVVSLRRPGGMILSTGNLYFTSHDELGAHVFRTAQTSSPGQEAELYREPPATSSATSSSPTWAVSSTATSGW
jgi:hypothetical protein